MQYNTEHKIITVKMMIKYRTDIPYFTLFYIIKLIVEDTNTFTVGSRIKPSASKSLKVM